MSQLVQKPELDFPSAFQIALDVMDDASYARFKEVWAARVLEAEALDFYLFVRGFTKRTAARLEKMREGGK